MVAELRARFLSRLGPGDDYRAVRQAWNASALV